MPLRNSLAFAANKHYLLGNYIADLMTPEERDEMNRLCQLIEDEKNHNRFMELIRQLNDLLNRKERRIDPTKPSD